MAQLFRKPIQEDDPQAAPEQNIEMPKSFVADNEDGSAGIPKSFIADEAPKKPSVFRAPYEAIVHPKPFDPQNDPIHKVVNAMKSAGETAKYKGDKPDLENRKDATAVGFDQDKWANEASKLPESWHGIPIRRPAAMAGSLMGTFLESMSAPENIAAMGAGGLKPKVETAERPLPIRQVDRRINPLRDTTPQQDAVAIALTKNQVPRTPANISDETGIPKASVRRTISELKKKTATEMPKISAAQPAIEETAAVKTPRSFIADTEALPEQPVENPFKKPGFVNPFEKQVVEAQVSPKIAPAEDLAAKFEAARKANLPPDLAP